MDNLVVAVDVGGTKIAGALVDAAGRVIWQEKVATKAQLGGPAVLERLHGLIAVLLDTNAVKGFGVIIGIGIGSAGEIDYGTGKVISATDNIPDWTGTEIKKSCEGRFGLPTFVDNDGNTATLGEMVFGAGRGVKDFVCLTIGTGVGGGVVSGGRILRGASNCAGALGHITIEWDGRPCNCGSVGCLEAYVSGPAIASRATAVFAEAGRTVLSRNRSRKNSEVISAETLFSLARENDTLATAVVEETATYLGWGLVSIANMLNPELIVVGGGVSEAGELLLAPARKVLQEHALPGITRVVKLQRTGLGEKSGILGAGGLAWQGLGPC